MDLDGALGSPVLGLSVALGGGLLIGLDRERRKGAGPGRQAAGIRSFTLAALAGALARLLDVPAVVALGAAAVAGLAALAYWRGPRDDPGLTTELALFVTYLVGVLSMDTPAYGAGAAAAVAALLAAREKLHRFATAMLTEAEVHDALLLAALLLVVLPLMPTEPIAWLAGFRPRTLALLLVLILALQGAGHVATRALGPRMGLPLAGLFAGFVSSTATIASMGTRARSEPALRAECAAGAVMSSASTWIQAMVMLATLAPALAAALLPGAAAGAAVSLAGGGLAAWHRDAQAPPVALDRRPLRVREALLVAVLLTGVALAVGGAERAFGGAGVLAASALAAVADAHAAVAAAGNLHAAGRIDGTLGLQAVLLAITANTVSRIATALVAGGRGFGLRVGLLLSASTGAAWAATLAARSTSVT